MPASFWTRKDVSEFKNSVRHIKENVIKISSLATATVSWIRSGWTCGVLLLVVGLGGCQTVSLVIMRDLLSGYVARNKIV